MTEKTFFLGSVGPLYFDDSEKAYSDTDMIDGDTVAPLQRAVWSDGAIEVEGGGGLSADYTGALDKMVAALANTPAANGVSFKTDKFTISPPGTETISPTPIFVVTTRDGNAAIGMNADLIVNGSILGNKIGAAAEITLNTGGKLAVGANDVLITSLAGGGGGRLSVWDRTAGGNNRSVFYRGAFAHYNDVDGETICQVPPRQIGAGYGSDGADIEINGEYPFVPTVMCYSVLVKPSVGDCLSVCHPGPVEKTNLDAGRYKFKMYAFTTNAKGIQVINNPGRVFTTYAYPSLPGYLWAPSSSTSDAYTATTDSGGVAKLFVQIMYRCKTNSGYGIRGNFELQVGLLSGTFTTNTTAYNQYESYADQDWRSVWLFATLSTTGQKHYKIRFTPNDFIPSRYEGIGGRLEYYVSTAVAYNQSWSSNYIQGAGGYIAYA